MTVAGGSRRRVLLGNSATKSLANLYLRREPLERYGFRLTTNPHRAVRSVACAERDAADPGVGHRASPAAGGDWLHRLSVHVTGGDVCPNTAAASTEIGQFLLDRIDAFESWADEHGRSLRPCFEYHENATAIDGSDCSSIELPAMVLAEYDADGLRFVAPSTDDTSTVTVRDRLEAIEREVNTDDDSAVAATASE